MAKVKHQFQVSITLNEEKGGGWLATYALSSDASIVTKSENTAWKNASAAKRWVKEKVQALTPRKSVKLTPVLKDGQSKPIGFTGSLEYNHVA